MPCQISSNSSSNRLTTMTKNIIWYSSMVSRISLTKREKVKMSITALRDNYLETWVIIVCCKVTSKWINSSEHQQIILRRDHFELSKITSYLIIKVPTENILIHKTIMSKSFLRRIISINSRTGFYSRTNKKIKNLLTAGILSTLINPIMTSISISRSTTPVCSIWILKRPHHINTISSINTNMINQRNLI